LQMPVDEIVPSREKESFKDKLKAEAEAAQMQAEQKAQAVQPDGSPKGGMDGNTVSNRDTGRAV
jgi:hypothetical protein